jgi:hypothetical protein
LRYVAPTLMTASVTFGLIAAPQAAADPEFPYPPCEPESVWKQMPPRCDEPSFGPDVPDVPVGPGAAELGAIAEGRAGLEHQVLRSRARGAPVLRRS